MRLDTKLTSKFCDRKLTIQSQPFDVVGQFMTPDSAPINAVMCGSLRLT